jgi:ACS family glucarate transporter-like MFS transporter
VPNKFAGAVIAYVLLFTMALINYLDRVALSVAAGPISKEFDLTPVQMGYLFSSFLWTYLICVIPAGILADRYGAKRVCSGGMGLWSVATVLTGAVAGFLPLLATRLVMGVGESTSYPSANKFIREQVPSDKRGFATTIFNSGAYAGPAFGAILIGWLVASFGWRIAFIIAGAIGLLWLVPWMVWFRGASENRAGDSAAPAIASSALARGEPVGAGLAGLLRSKSMWGIAVTQGCGVYTQYLFLTWLPSYLQAAKGMDLKQAAIYTALPYICAVILGILLGKVSDKLLKPGHLEAGKRRPMVAVMMICSSAILLTPLVNNVWTVVALLSISLTGISTAISLNMALLNDLLDSPDDAGKANSLALVGGNAFGIVAPIATGYIVAATHSYSYAFATAGALLLFGAVVSQVFTRERIGAEPFEGRDGLHAREVMAAKH